MTEKIDPHQTQLIPKKISQSNNLPNISQKDMFIEVHIQNAETVIDSVSQRLTRLCGKNSQIAKDSVYVLREIRKIQFRYYPVKQHSLLRYNGKYFSETGEKTAKELEPTKHNWRKYKKDKELTKHPKLERHLS